MAVGTGTVWQIQSTATAANANGGGFNPGNANFPTDLAATSATGNSPVVTSASYNFAAGDVDAWVYVQSGTNWTPGWYQIASVASNAATLKAAIGEASQRSTTTGYPTPKYGLNTVAGCATTASPTGGVWGLDYSRTDTAPFADTDLASLTGTTNPATITSAGKPFGVNHVGNIIHITAGTNWTQGWYELVSVAVVTATLDRAVGTNATLTGGTFKVGGAISLGSATANQTDSNFFGAAHIPTAGGNRFFIKGAVTYTAGGAITTAAGATALPHVINGYQTYRGDNPLTTGRPTLAMGGTAFTLGSSVQIWNVIATGSASAGVITTGSMFIVAYCKILNNSTNANRSAFIGGNFGGTIFSSELVSYRGQALQSNFVIYLNSNYVHDSNIGISLSGSNGSMITNNIIESNVLTALDLASGANTVLNNTVYGSENTTGTGISLASGVNTSAYLNNIIYGFVTGATVAASQVNLITDYNDFFNNDADVSNWQKGSHDLALNPTFTNVAQVTGTAGAFTAGNDRLVDTSKNFTSLGVVAGDCVYIISGTGVTAGIYGISSITTTTNPNDTIILDLAPGNNTTANKVYQITVGHNFMIGTNLKAGAYPGVFPGGLTTGYLDIGAVQIAAPADTSHIVKFAGDGGGFVG